MLDVIGIGVAQKGRGLAYLNQAKPEVCAC